MSIATLARTAGSSSLTPKSTATAPAECGTLNSRIIGMPSDGGSASTLSPVAWISSISRLTVLLRNTRRATRVASGKSSLRLITPGVDGVHQHDARHLVRMRPRELLHVQAAQRVAHRP